MVRGYNPAGSRRRAAHARRYPAWDIRKSSAGGVFGSSHRSGGMADRLTGWIVHLFQETPHSSTETDVRPPQLAASFIRVLNSQETVPRVD